MLVVLVAWMFICYTMLHTKPQWYIECAQIALWNLYNICTYCQHAIIIKGQRWKRIFAHHFDEKFININKYSHSEDTTLSAIYKFASWKCFRSLQIRAELSYGLQGSTPVINSVAKSISLPLSLSHSLISFLPTEFIPHPLQTSNDHPQCTFIGIRSGELLIFEAVYTVFLFL